MSVTKICPQCGTTYEGKVLFCPTDASTLRPTEDSGDLVGTVVADRYLVTERIGEGGMGRVYAAQHVRLPQRAAIKVLHPALLHDADALARFNREASNLCRIRNAHVATVYDFGETGDGMVYLAMEFVQGVTLGQLLAREGPLSPSRAAGLIRQVADGLDAAHKLGIVHRDLKPDNILVTRDDGAEFVKVVDFGIAKAVQGEGQAVTQLGLVSGTREFMSPEQILGGPLDHRTDVYALGLVAFLMLTGKSAFQGPTPDQSMLMRLREPPQRLAAARPEVAWPAGLQYALDGALAREVEQRTSSAGAFARAVADAAKVWQEESEATPNARPIRLPVPPAASRAPAPEAAGVPDAPATPAPGRRRTTVWAGAAAALLLVGGLGAWGYARAHTDPGTLVVGTTDTSAADTTVVAQDPDSARADTTTVGGPGADSVGSTAADSTSGGTQPAGAGGDSAGGPGAPNADGSTGGTKLADRDTMKQGASGGRNTKTGGAVRPGTSTGGDAARPSGGSTGKARLSVAAMRARMSKIDAELLEGDLDPQALNAIVFEVGGFLPALATSADTVAAELLLGQAHQALGRCDEAKEAFTTAREHARTEGFRKAAENYLANLGCD